MPAIITGTVFNDLNHNGIFDGGEPGIPNVDVVIRDPNGVCQTVLTDGAGVYTFSGLTIAGNYDVYETAVNPGVTCPPTNFVQPPGFTNSSTYRKEVINVTLADISGNVTISGRNYGHDNPTLFTCAPVGYQVASPGSGTNSSFEEINIVTGVATNISPNIGFLVNAIGYNVLDDMIYGIDMRNRTDLIRIANDGTATSFGPILNLPTPGTPYIVGTIDNNGVLYVHQRNSSTFYLVDVDQNSPTFGELLSSVGLGSSVDLLDWAFSPIDNQLYSIDRDSGDVLRINPTTGAVTTLTTTGVPAERFGAMFMDSAGVLYAIENDTGDVYRITISGGNATGEVFSQSVIADLNDGASCQDALIEADFGDAPDISPGNGPGDYSTLLANNGPRHQIISGLTLGILITGEPDAYQNPTATGDDTLNPPTNIPDDGVATPLTPLPVTGGIYSIPVNVTNTTGIPANLYGWIDYDKDGYFEPTEAAPVQIIPSAPGIQLATLNFTAPGGLIPGNTFVRIRLTTDNLQDTGPAPHDGRSLGPASNGEVEDYILEISEDSADISVLKTDSPDPVIAGETLTYTITVNNAGPSSAQNVILTDAVPPEILNPEYSLDGGTTWNPWTGSVNLGTLAPLASVTVLIRGVVDPSTPAGTTLTNTATVSSTTPDPDPTNNTFTQTTQVNTSADISVVKTDSPDPVIAGETLTYTMTVNNAGPSDAQNVILTDVVPPQILSPEYSLDGGTTWNPWTGSVNLGTLAAGASVTVLIRGVVDPSTPLGTTITNTATVSSTTPDPDQTNNTSTETTQVDTSADVSVVKTDIPDPVIAGETLTYNIVVSNAGPSDAQNVILTDAVPPEILNPEYSLDGGITWNPWTGSVNLGTLAAGTSVTVLIRGIVDPSTPLGTTITNTATVSSTTPDPDPTNNTSTQTTQVDTSADVSVVKTDIPDPVIAGETLTYNIVVSNAGPSDAQNVILTDAVPAEILNPEYSLDGGTTWNPWLGSISLGTLAAGASVTVLIRGVVDPSTPAGTTLTNTATVSSTTSDPDPTNNTSTETTQVDTSADVSVVKTDIPDPVIAGETLTYTMVVANAGPSDAQNVILTDAVPPQILNPEYSLDGGTTWNPWLGSVNLGTLAPGASVTVLIRGVVDPSTPAGSTIINTATVSSTTPDPDPTNNTSTQTTQVDTSADVSVVKTDIPDPVIAGETLTYNIVVSNAGPSDAQSVMLTDAVPAEILNPEYSLDGGITWNPWTGSINLGTLAAGASVTVLIRGVVDPTTPAGATIINTATVSSTTPDPDPTNNTSTQTTQVDTSADVSVVKTDSPDPVIAGETLTYNIVVSNAGPSDAQNVILTDAVPAEMLNPEYSLDGGITWNPWTGSINLGTLAAGASVTVLIRGVVDPTTPAGATIINTATVSSTTPDPDPTNNTSTQTTQVDTSADVSVVKTDSPDPVIAGGTLTYTMVVSNAGPSNAQNVTLTDVVPAEILNPEYSLDGGITWNPWLGSVNLGTLAAGASVTVLIRGVVDPTTPVGTTITNTATVSSTTPDPDPTNNTSTETTQVDASADVSVVKTDIPDPVIAGETLTYTIVVSNAGPSNAQNVTLTDAVPAEILNPEYSLDGGITWNPWLGSINLGTLAPGASVTVLIRGVVDPSTPLGSTITNTAIVSSTTPDPDSTNNTSTQTTQVDTSADVSVVKTDSPDPVIAGETLTYTIVVSNAGPSNAQNVTLTDAVPPEILNPEYSLNGGITWNPWTGSVNLGTLAPGASVTVLIRGVVDPSTPLGTTITNTATVSSTTPDTDPTNNTSTARTQVDTSADVSVVKTDSPDPVIAGETLTYTMVVANAGPSNAQNVILTDAVPAEILNPEYSLDGGTTWNPWTGSVNLGTLAAGASVTVLIRGVVNPSTPAGSTITNTATVSSTTPDPDPTNNTFTQTTQVDTSADVSVVKTDIPDPVMAGETLTYTMVVANAGPSDAQNVILTDAVPPEILNPEYSLDGGITWNPWTGSVNLGTLAAGVSVTVLIRGVVDPTTPAGATIINTATVSSTTPDPDPTNNTFTQTTQVDTSADVSVVKTDSPDPVMAGETLTYTIVVANAGPSSAQNVILTDAVPAEILNPQYSLDGGITWNPWTGSISLGTLAPGASVTVLIRGVVDPTTPAGATITNTATVSSTTPDPDPTNNTSTARTQVDTSADVSVVKTDSPDPVIAGETLTYTMVVANAGPSIAEDVTLTDVVPSEILNPEYSIDGGITWNPWPITNSINLGDIPVGGTVTVQIRGTVSADATGSITNTVVVDSITPDPDPSNNTDTEITQVDTLADISVDKTSNPNPVIAGEQLIYTMTVNNAGPSVAQDVTLTDVLPAEILNPEYSIDGGPWNPWPITNSINLGDIPVGGTVTVQIRGIVSPDATGSITNTVVVDSITPDPDPSNNTDTETTQVDTLADISVDKTSNPNPVIAGEQLTYTMTVNNAGPSVAQDVTLTDVVPPEILNPQYSIDGGPWNLWPIINSINLGDIPAGGTVVVQIRGIVRPDATGSITNTVVVDSITPDPDPSNNTDTEITQVDTLADISVIKTSTPNPVIAGEQLTYTMTVNNAGPSVAQGVTLIDVVPSEILNPEYSIDGGITWNPWPITNSINLGDIPVGGTVTVQIRGTVSPDVTGSITNTVVVDSITPDPNPNNNTDTEITQVDTLADISVDKTSNPSSVIAGEQLTYTMTVNNVGPSVAQDVTLTDVLPSEILNPEYSIDGGITWNPWPITNSINLGDIPVGGTVTVQIRGTVSPDATGNIVNTAVVDSTTPDPIISNNTDTEITQVVKVELEVIKSVDKESANVGDILTYTVVITNTGDIPIDNVIFSDIIPPGTVLVGSQQVQYVPLGTILPGQSKIVTFQVKIVSKPCPPKLINKATVTGTYTIDGTQRKLIVESNEVVTYVGVSIFKQLSVDTNVKIPPQKPEAEDIIEVIAYVDITYTYLIKTPIVTSYEGQELTGWKLIIEGIIIQKVVYIANEPTQSVHAAEFEIPFSTFVILPKDYKPCSDVKVTGYIEDDFAKLLSDRRTIFKNITLLIEGKTGC